MGKIKFILYSIIFIIIILAIIILKTGGINLQNSPEKSKDQLSVGITLLNENKTINQNLPESDKKYFKGDFIIDISSNKDNYFDVILINNFKQINFSINGSKKQKIHELYIPKTESNKYIRTSIVVYTEEIMEEINDCELILLRKSDNPSKNSGRQNSYAKRFFFVNPSKEINLTKEDSKQIYSKDLVAINENLGYYFFLLEKPLSGNEQIGEDTQAIRYVDGVKVSEKKTLNFYINIKESLKGSPFYEGYLNDQNHGKTQSFAIFALLDGRLYPLNYSGSKEKYYELYQIALEKSAMIYPEITIDTPGTHLLNIFIVSYPFSDPTEFKGTYKMSSWSNIITSYEIPIVVSE